MQRRAAVDTLPDYLAPGLDVIFVGINPGMHSAKVGHYFATPTNRFWPALNRSGLLTEPLDAGTDDQVLRQGIGFNRRSEASIQQRLQASCRGLPPLGPGLEGKARALSAGDRLLPRGDRLPQLPQIRRGCR